MTIGQTRQFTGKVDHFDMAQLPKLRQTLDDLGKKTLGVDQTTLWQYSVERNTNCPELFFYHTPPITTATIDNRIIFLGTNSQVREAVLFFAEYQGKSSADHPKLSFCSQVGEFWASFYGKANFLDALEGVTIPGAIVASGQMRNYNYMGGETITVTKRLQEIADDWGIPLYVCVKEADFMPLKSSEHPLRRLLSPG